MADEKSNGKQSQLILWLPLIVTLIIFFMTQSIAAIWWAASLSKSVDAFQAVNQARLEVLENRVANNRERTVQDITELKKSLEKIDEKLDKLIQNKNR